MKRKGSKTLGKNGKKLDTHTFLSIENGNKSQKNFFSSSLCFAFLPERYQQDKSRIFLEGGNSVHEELLAKPRVEWNGLEGDWKAWMSVFKAFCVQDFRCLHVFYYRILNPSSWYIGGASRRAVESYPTIFHRTQGFLECVPRYLMPSYFRFSVFFTGNIFTNSREISLCM